MIYLRCLLVYHFIQLYLLLSIIIYMHNVSQNWYQCFTTLSIETLIPLGPFKYNYVIFSTSRTVIIFLQ